MSRRQTKTTVIEPVNGNGKHDEAPAPPQRYGGIHTGAWVDALPASWIPYVQLARLSPPVPLLLIFFPHLFGLLHAAVVYRIPPPEILSASLVLFGGSFFVSNAIHGWNDLIDAPIDRQIPRTRNRPVARGAVSEQAAFIFTVSQALLALCFLPLLPEGTATITIPSIIAHAYYPFSKRHTYFPQVVLGVAMQWAVVVGSYSLMGGRNILEETSLLSLFFGCLLWTVVYDGVYGFQDYEEDLRIGVKSIAVLFGKKWGKPILWILSNAIVLLLLYSGFEAGMSVVYLAAAAGGSFASLNLMMAMVDISSADSCCWWFTYGFWGPALSMSAGLLGEYFITSGLLNQILASLS